MKEYYKRFCTSHDLALRSLEVTDRNGIPVTHDAGFELWCALSSKVLEANRCQYLVGNGASAAFANHMALDWTKNGGVPTHSFSSAALLTAMGNDLGFAEAFAAPLGWYSRADDLLVTISSSGNSENIVKSIEVGRERGALVVTLSGLKPDNRSRGLGDLNFYIPGKTYGIVECAHQVLLHVWLDRYMGIMEWEREGYQNMNKSEFQL